MKVSPSRAEAHEAAERQLRVTGENITLRVRAYSIAAVYALGFLGDGQVQHPSFDLVILAAIPYEFAVRAALLQQWDIRKLNLATSLADSGLLALAIFFSGGRDSGVVPFPLIAMTGVAMRLPLQGALLVAAANGLAMTAIAFSDGASAAWVAAYWLYLGIAILFVSPIARVVFERYADVIEAQAAQRALLHRHLRGVEVERRRIANDLHDRGGGALFLLLHGLRKLRSLTAGDDTADREARLEADRMITVAERSLGELRGFLSDLRPQILDDLGLSQALLDLLTRERTVSGGLEIEYENESRGDDPPAEHALALYRVTQEALTNVRRHAEATRLRVRIERRDAGWRLEIEDDGIGMDGLRPGLGLRTMRERVEAVGGAFRVDSTPGAGTHIRADVPATEGSQ